jgi:ribose transport system substrate-binding protein
MRRSMRIATAGVALFGLIALAGCTTDPSVAPAESDSPDESAETTEWFDQELFDKQMQERGVEPQGPADEPYLQHINAEMVDTSEFVSEGPRRPASRTRRSRTRGVRPAGSR